MFPANAGKPRLRAGLSRRGAVGKPSSSNAIKSNPSLRPALKPIQTTTQPSKRVASAAQNASTVAKDSPKAYFSVLYTKRSKKKHKSWLDGYVILTNDRHVQLLNEDGKALSSDRFMKPVGGLRNGNTLEIGTWQLEVQDAVSEDDYISGRLFAPPSAAPVVNKVMRQKPFKALQSRSSEAGAQKKTSPVALHDPNAPGAVVLLPVVHHASNTSVPVVLDPFLARHMRPHQKDGVQFLFECTAGKKFRDGDDNQGAILGDEMGLGKSLQAIALVWTLLKQGPLGAPLAQKAVIVCPASLVPNWVAEIRKWLGDERLRPVALESGVSTYDSKEAMAAFVNGNVKRLLIISYELFRSHAEDIYRSHCGLIVCDEGHRLKSAGGNKTIDALRKLTCRRRVILTGTPVQNDLDEFFAVCDFVNPGCLNTLASFRSVFANPIIASRDSHASVTVRDIGEARARELARVTSLFVLRRTSSLLEKYLPPKRATAIFCRLRPEQEKKYEKEARDRFIDFTDCRRMNDALSAINCLRKICSHPLLYTRDESSDSAGRGSDSETRGTPQSTPRTTTKADINEKDSGKMLVALAICKASLAVGDKVVFVSNFTSSLDLVESVLVRQKISHCRLDGNTAVSHRGNIVNAFNGRGAGDVFLLSAKAGGVGLNLIGANRLIMYDPDWNPATDLQAMARVWRDGQKKSVFVYRLLSTGTIEEKIFQRQLFKSELQVAVDGKTRFGGSETKDGNFKAEELKDLFQYRGAVPYCETLEVLERSQDEETTGEGSTGAKGLLQRFSAYRDRAVKEQAARGVVWCDEDDEVLDKALNIDMDTHEVVSYLYTKSTDTSNATDMGAPPSNLRRCNTRADGQSKKRKRSLISHSDDESISSGGPSVCKSQMNRRTEKPRSLPSTLESARAVELVDKSAGDSRETPTGCRSELAANMLIADGRDTAVATVGSVRTLTVQPEMTWEEALKGLEVEGLIDEE